MKNLNQSISSPLSKSNLPIDLPKQISAQKDGMIISYKLIGLVLWLSVCLLCLLEIKRHYNIDVIPGYDSSVDDIYGFVRGFISELFQ